jgi:DNA invertase Pin-like site-specific DNA recombinase
MVAIYCRKSSKVVNGKEDTSINTQLERGEAFAGNLGEKYIIYNEGTGTSGTLDIDDRYQLDKLIKDIKDGVVDKVYAINQSRIERNPTTWRIFVSTMLLANASWYPDGKYFDLDSTENRLQANMMSIMNEYHADNTSRLVKLAFEANARKGKVHGVLPFGYCKDEAGYFKVNTEEANIIKYIFDLSLSGVGSFTIANILNDEGIATRYDRIDSKKVTNKRWFNSTVLGILKNTIYKGKRRWKQLIFDVPSIISEQDFDRVQLNLFKNKKNKVGKNITYKYLMNGLLHCEECNKEYKGKLKKKDGKLNDYSYKCKGNEIKICTHSRAVNIPKFDSFILTHLFADKDLQKYLNSIEVDTDELDLLNLKLKKLKSSLTNAKKKESRIYNLLIDEAFADNTRMKGDYLKVKEEVLKLGDSVTDLATKISAQNDNNRNNTLNTNLRGFDFNSEFSVTKNVVHRLIERINVSYVKDGNNGWYTFKIKYWGFNETCTYRTNHNMLTYINIHRGLDDTKPHNYDMFFEGRFKREHKTRLDIFLNKDKIVKFEV